MTKRIAWDDEAIEHIAKHGVTPEQVEDCLTGMPIKYDAAFRKGEYRESFIGPMRTGRLLFVVVTERGGTLRVVTAYRTDRIKTRWYRAIIRRMTK